MNKVNISALAREYGISRESLRSWRGQGLDLSDPKALLERIKIMRGKAEDDAPADGSESLADAKRRRAVADADIAEMRAQKESGELIDLATVESAFAEVGHILRSRLLALPNAAAVEIEGMSAVQIAKALKCHVTQILTDLYENNPIEKLTAPPATDQKPSRGKRMDA